MTTESISWAFRNLMFLMKDKIPARIVISQTDELNKFWRDYVPEKYILKHCDPGILDAVFERQKYILNHPQWTDEKDKKAPFFVLLDDVISDHRLRYDANLMELFVAGRHYRLFVLITTQYAKAITPTPVSGYVLGGRPRETARVTGRFPSSEGG